MGQCRHCERNGVERGNPIIFPLLVSLFLFLPSCHRTNDPLIGRWTVEKVNVEFNEQIATPEMVRQYGEMEKGNVIEIGQDSTLVFVSDGDTVGGKCSLEGSQLFCDGKLFGSLEGGKLITQNKTPIGTIEVVYLK